MQGRSDSFGNHHGGGGSGPAPPAAFLRGKLMGSGSIQHLWGRFPSTLAPMILPGSVKRSWSSHDIKKPVVFFSPSW